MTRKQRRMTFVLGGMTVLAVAVGLVLSAFQDNLVFFHSPTEVHEKGVPPDRRFRVGGLVVEDSVRQSGLSTSFEVTDTVHSVRITYEGILPTLFREGQGIVAVGKLNGDGVFVAQEVLAKHDENYMPPEVAESLKEAGVWKGGQ
ncbi:MAG: cytochrome c maturation protein CcmE [Minwuiales bacterium]|nr:cytochrome c maturation protein CcmE [Minwuiales bacterium]